MIRNLLKHSAASLSVAFFALGAFAINACAFTETQIAPAQAEALQQAPAKPLNTDGGSDSSGLTLSMPDNNASDETELTIPGVGTIGTIPKMEFGLELLYGNSAEETIQDELDNGQDDVLIKGKIRHRF